MEDLNDHYLLGSKDVYKILIEKKVEFLYHANTLLTSITFIEQDALLSRHFVETNELHQSIQKSDNDDKLHSVWDYVFLDAFDLHAKYLRPNAYGPILFRMKLEMLLSDDLPHVVVTRGNPMHWKEGITDEQKFYKDIGELNQDYLTGKKLDSQIMFTIKSPERKISLSKFLHSIGVDKPNILVKLRSGTEKYVGDHISDEISEALNNNGLNHIPVVVRHAKRALCGCGIVYNQLSLTNFKEFKRRFSKHLD